MRVLFVCLFGWLVFCFFCFFFWFVFFFSDVLCYASGFYMLLFFCQMFLTRVCVCVCCSLALYSAIEHV